MFDLDDYNLTKDGVRQRLQQKDGVKYAVPDILLVKVIRQALKQRRRDIADPLFIYLLKDRYSNIITYRFFRGLQQYPNLLEEAIAELITRVWKELYEEKDLFIEQNFYVYLSRMGIEVYTMLKRSEGMQGIPEENAAFKPMHIPQSMLQSIDVALAVGDTVINSEPIDPHDAFADLEQQQHIASLLRFLPNPVDRLIVYKRTILEQHWNEIALDLQKSDRTVRTHFEDAMHYLRKYIQGDDK